MTKFLFIGDPHIKQDNSNEVDILIGEIERVFKEELPDFIIVGGDVMHYHERLYTQSLNKSLDFFKKLTSLAYTFVLVGNHDYINNSEFLSENHWMNSLKSWTNIEIVDKVIDKNYYMLCPYVFPGRFIEALETQTKDWRNKKFIFAHQEFKGCKMGAIVSTTGDEWDEKFPIVISGHIHDNQKIGENILYPGTPLQHSFGDTDKRVLCLIEYLEYTNNINIKEIELNVPKKRIIKTTIKNLKDLDAKCNENTKIKLDVSTDEFKLFKESKEYKDLIKKGVKIQIQKRKDDIQDIQDIQDLKIKNDDFISILKDLIKDEEDLVKKIFNDII
jgi:DNA repair exonuclease SbcCD nuclease subunit